MDKNLDKLWNDTLKIIKEEITQVSFETWIKRIEPISYFNNVVVLGVENDFTKGILEARYSILIVNSLKHVTGENLVVEFTIPSSTPIVDNTQQPTSKAKHDKQNYSTNTNLNPKYQRYT